MENKNKKANNSKNSTNTKLGKIGFWKANWALLVLILLAFVVILTLGYVLLSPYWNKKSLEKDISSMETTSLISIDKVVCYSSAYATTNAENQARWNVNISQYTDLAIYLNSQTNITNMYIDNITFSNSDTGNLSLSKLSADDFGKSPISNSNSVQSSNESENDNIENIVETSSNNLNTINTDRIDLDLTLPITVRYLNYNLKENCLISDIETPLSFDGNILKRGKVTLSSLKNTISFTLHVTDSSNQEYTYPISIPINLQNTENEESIYDGSYTEELPFENAYFYISK